MLTTPRGVYFRTVSLTVDGVRLEFSTTLPEIELSSLLADLAPLDIASQNIYRQEPPAS